MSGYCFQEKRLSAIFTAPSDRNNLVSRFSSWRSRFLLLLLTTTLGVNLIVTDKAWAQAGRQPLPNLAEPESEKVPDAPPNLDFTDGQDAIDIDSLPAGFDRTVPSIEVVDPLGTVPGPLGTENTNLCPENPDTPEAFNDYRLGPGDAFFVSVQRFPDLSFVATLDADGMVIVPIEGAVSFEGLTLDEAENRIRTIYNRYVVIREIQVANPALADSLVTLPLTQAEKIVADIHEQYLNQRDQRPGRLSAPDVTLSLTAQRGVEITIRGEVERPGFYPLPDPSVSTALLIAGGATHTADLRSLEVQRRLINGSVISGKVNLFESLRDGCPVPSVSLEDGDVLIVHRLDPSNLDGYDTNLVSRSTLAQPEITVRFLNYAGGGAGGGAGRLGVANLPNGSTFVDAISQLGVSPDAANLRQVALIRYDPESGQAIPLTIDANAAFRGDLTQNPSLRDNDVIIVGRNLLNRITFALNTFTQPFRDVLSFLLFFDSLFNNDLFNNNN